MQSIRSARSDDAAEIVRLAVDNHMFAPEESALVLDLARTLDAGDAALGFVSHADDGRLSGVVIAQPKAEAPGVWDLTMIAIDPAEHGKGIGARLLSAMERECLRRFARMIYVETSGTEEYATARYFYAANGYTQQAHISDYWAQGDDLVILTKSLTATHDAENRAI